MKEKRDTVGKISGDLSQKTPESTDPIEIQRAMQEDYIKNIIECIKTNKSKFDGDFYIVVITKNEKLMPNVFRNYFAARSTCPTPDYDQSVFRYYAQEESVDYVWTLPSKDAMFHLRDNAIRVHHEERELLRFVLEFFDGSLDILAKKLNGEEADSPLLIKQ